MGFILEECKEVQENYTKCSYLQPLIKVIELCDEAADAPYLKIRWLENNTELVKVDIDGWFVISSEKYPTFEALAMKQSQLFKAKWAEALTKRLEQLDEEEDTLG